MVLALGVGVLIGARACSTETEPEVVTKVETVTVEKLVYTCPPEPEPEPPKKLNDPKLGKRKSDGKKTLPDETESDDALRRRRLLAWVREQASDLKTCNNASTETFRLAVTLQIDSSHP